MCWFGISEPSQTLISLNSSTLLEINIKSRKAAALLFLTSSNLTRPLCSRNACGTERGLCSLRYQFLSMRNGCVFSISWFSFSFHNVSFCLYKVKKSRRDQWVSYCLSLRKNEKGASLADSLTWNTKEATDPRFGAFLITSSLPSYFQFWSLRGCTSKNLSTSQGPKEN